MRKTKTLRALRSRLRLATMYFRFNLSAAMEYRASFLASALGMFFSNATFIFFWGVLFSHTGGDIGGYSFRDTMFIWGASSSAFGLVNVLFGNIRHINDLVINGALDSYLLQPRNVLLSLSISRTEFTAWGDLIYGLALVLLTGQGLGGFLGYLLAVFTGGAVLAAVIVILQSTVFYLGDSSFLSSMSVNLAVNFTTYPVGIFPKFVQLLLYFTIPAQFVVHVPLRIARGEDVLMWLPLQLIATVAFVALAFLSFYKGLKRYESGNLIVTRT